MIDMTTRRTVILAALIGGTLSLVACLAILTAPLFTYRDVSIAGHDFHLAVADTNAKRTRGLAAYATLPDNTGMIFTGLNPDQLSFWMKDMHYPIDILWVNSDDEVVFIESSLAPDTYPHVYQNPLDLPASYVIELPAGTCKRYNITPGTVIIFR